MKCLVSCDSRDLGAGENPVLGEGMLSRVLKGAAWVGTSRLEEAQSPGPASLPRQGEDPPRSGGRAVGGGGGAGRARPSRVGIRGFALS